MVAGVELEKAPPPPKVVFDTRALGGWDSGSITFLLLAVLAS